MADAKKPALKRGSSIAGLIAIILAWAAMHASGWTVMGSNSSSAAGQDHGLRVQASAVGDGTGAMRVTVVGCEGHEGTYDQVRYLVHSASGWSSPNRRCRR